MSFLCSGWQKEGRQEQPLIGYIYIMDWNVEKGRTQIPFTRIVLYGKEPGRETFSKKRPKELQGIVGNKRLEETETYGKYQII